MNERTNEYIEEAPAADHKAEACRLRASGLSIGEIALRLGRSKATIHAWVKDVKVRKRVRQLPSFPERRSPVERDQEVLSLKRRIAILKHRHELRGLEKQEALESFVEQSQGQLTTAYLLGHDQLVYDGQLYDLADARGREDLKAAATAPAALAAFGIVAVPGSTVFYSSYLPHRDPHGKLLRAYDVTQMRWLSPREYELREFLLRACLAADAQASPG